MKIRELFAQDITRRIEGVVKVADETNLLNEMREFVITEEIQKVLLKFFGRYTEDKPVNPGVWLSGFFGTGKSHLLKILSLLLSNKEVEGIRLGDYFKEKTLNEVNDFELEGYINMSLRVPTQTILFNIDSVVDNAYREGDKNILMPFKKMFDSALGYSDDPSVAKLERDLNFAGKLEIFKEIFKRISGKEWEDSRGRLLVMGDELDAAFAEALGRDPASTTDIATKYENETPLSLDSFINDIREYLATKPTGFRLVFLVDEIGQYISRDPRTMLNLQTLIEDLAVAFNGRVWVMVTAQEEVTDMVKSMGIVQKSDYSKILGRFEIKVKLSSQNARDVIEKRLLRKKPETDKIIRDYFEQQGEVIKTRFTFPGDTSFSDKLLDEDSFARFYPILPYQVELFQNCLISLSNHGAFEGNYASLGARSMLSVFQNALIEIKDGEFGSFVPFDLFFEGTRPLMKAQPFHTIILLESKGEDPFSIRLLKLLYILKYESGFKTTVKNLAVLISKDSESDRRETERLIQNSLDRLARYNYVQEVNGVFEFQTDIQQEILKRIIATELNQGEIRNHIAEIFFDEMLGRNNFLKLKHDRTGLDFPYTKKIDGHDYKKPFGDIKLNLVTGAEEDYPTETELRTLSMAHYELVIALPKNRKLIEDVALLLRTHRFSSQAGTEQMSDEKQAVLASKKRENDTRRVGIVNLIKTLISEARFFFNGREITNQTADFHYRLKEASQILIDDSYIYLNKLTKVPKKEDIINLLRNHVTEQFIAEFGGFDDVENELLMHIAKGGNSGVKVDLRSTIDFFKRIPYGYMDDLIIPHALVNLFINGKVTIYYNVTEMTANDIQKRIDNSKEYASIVVKTNEDISPVLIQEAKRFHFEWFGKQVQATDTKLVIQEMKESLGKESKELKNLSFLEKDYPFLQRIKHTIERMERALLFESKKFYEYIIEITPSLMEGKEELDRIRHFMNGPNRKLYDSIKDFLRVSLADLDLVESPNKDVLADYIQSPAPYMVTTFNTINNALIDLKEMVNDLTDMMRQDLRLILSNTRKELPLLEGYTNIPPNKLHELDTVLKSFEARIDGAPGLASLHNISQWFVVDLNTKLLQKLHDLQPVIPPVPPVVFGGGGGEDPPVSVVTPKPEIIYIQLRNLKSDYVKKHIASPQEVEEYLSSLREKMLNEIRNGKRIIPG